jgi:serine/threonine protein kinase
VKQLFNTTQQSMDEFLNEDVLLTSIKHHNLVKLKGCFLRGDHRLLADVLFGKFMVLISYCNPFSWLYLIIHPLQSVVVLK